MIEINVILARLEIKFMQKHVDMCNIKKFISGIWELDIATQILICTPTSHYFAICKISNK